MIDTKNVTIESMNEMINKCFIFFSKYLDKQKLSIDETDGGFDINYNFSDKQYELGSYGIRSCEFLDWIYGTGCAEPRLSSIINLNRNGISS